MKKEKYLSFVLKCSALFLWYFVALFAFIVLDGNRAEPLLKEGTALGDMMIRFPYQWDFELFFAGLFLVWGIFLWRSTRTIERDMNMIQFTGWAFLMHAVTMIGAGMIRTQDFVHLLTDSIPWYVLGFLIVYLEYRRRKTI